MSKTSIQAKQVQIFWLELTASSMTPWSNRPEFVVFGYWVSYIPCAKRLAEIIFFYTQNPLNIQSALVLI